MAWGRMRSCAAVLLVLCSAGAGCKPKIHSFRADPNVACQGTGVRLSWEASSGGEISSAPESAGLGEVQDSGVKTVVPATTTRYRLEASNLWGSAMREVDVDVRSSPAEPKPIGASVADPSARCEGTTLSVTALAPFVNWDAQLRVAAIELPAEVARHYHVEHAGIRAELDPGVRSTAFAGTPVRGEWLLSTPLQPGEACGSNVPRTLLINVYAACSMEPAP